jgi:hypothetical protein
MEQAGGKPPTRTAPATPKRTALRILKPMESD